MIRRHENGHNAGRDPLDHDKRRSSRITLGEFALGTSLGLVMGIPLAAGIYTAAPTIKLDAQIHKLDAQPAANPELDEKVNDTLTAVLDKSFNATCEDTTQPTSGSPGAYGYVRLYKVPFTQEFIPSDRIHLNNSVCRDIAKIAVNSQFIYHNEAIALTIATHERMHKDEDILDEAEAQCKAEQLTAGQLLAKGYDKENIRGIADSIRPFHEQLPAKYHSPKCKVGGEFDITATSDEPASNIWLTHVG